MEMKKLGNTGVDVPVLGMGTWQLVKSVPDREIDSRAIESLRLGIELGMTLIDTAEEYGTGHAEEIVGEAIKGLRDKVFIATKVSDPHFSYEPLIDAAEASLKRLGTDYIDLYQLHRPNPYIPIQETMQTMEQLVDEGRVRYIGVSNFSLAQLRRAQKFLNKHQIICNQVEYNLLYREVETELLSYARKHEITIMAYSPFATGYMFRHSGKGATTITDLAEKYDKTFAQICLNWLIERSPVITIPKAFHKEHTRENAGAAGWRMDTEDYRLIDEAFA